MFKKIFLSLIVVVLIFGTSKMSFAMMCSADSGHSEPAQAAPQSSSEKAINVGNKICPVSDEKIDETMKAAYEYKGKIYNFCCASCIDEFKKDPDKYAKKVEMPEESMHGGGHHH